MAREFTGEFETMWGGSNDQPDSSKAAFHQYKKQTSNATIRFSNESRIQPYFAPMNKERSRPNLLELVADLISKEADYDIKICAFSFSTDVEIDQAIKEKFESKGLDIKAVFDKTGKTTYSLYSAMTMDPISRKPWSKKAEAYLAREDRQLHHKYILIDAENPDKNDIPIVITGSFNFSKNANEVNDDNFLIIHDRVVANQYLQEFYSRFNTAKRLFREKKEAESIEEVSDETD
jgi:phosphatidylserine/phosphatidylglycerophosphate/cardiolipin synthase-like enzyme